MMMISAAGSGGTNGLINGMEDQFIGIGADCYKLAASRLARNYLAPHASDKTAYLRFVEKLIEKFGIRLFIPNSDLEVFTIATSEKFDTFPVCLPDRELIIASFDKWSFFLAAKEAGVRVANTYRIMDRADIEEAFERLQGRPLWCRAKSGSGSRYTARVFNVEEAESYIRHTTNVNGLEVGEFLLCEYLPGEDIAVMTLWDNGAPRMCKMAKRTKYSRNAGESPPTVLESFFDKTIERFVLESIKKLSERPHGVINADIKCDDAGIPVMTEINPGRFYYNMQLFNSGRYPAFPIFLDIAFGRSSGYVTEDPGVVFVREQDNAPVVVSRKRVAELCHATW